MSMDSIINYEKNPDEDYYKILGCTPSSTMEQILAEYKAKVKSVHPDRQGDTQTSNEEFKKLAEAKVVLVDSEMRKSYDNWLNSGMAMSFKEWKSLGESMTRSSMHWATPKVDGRMLQNDTEVDENLYIASDCNLNEIIQKDTKSLKDGPILRQFRAANRRDSNLSSMVLTQKISDSDMRKKFRNYKI